MTDRRAIVEYVAVSRAAQGLPPTVTDPAVLARVAVLLDSTGTAPGGGPGAEDDATEPPGGRRGAA